MRCSLQQIFQQHFGSYAQQHALCVRERTAARCIAECFTAARGAHTLECPAGHVAQVQFHACRHRSCPRCAERPRQLWLQAQLERLLPCPHFHVVATLPHVLLPLWAFNRAALGALLLGCVRDTLLELMAAPRLAGVRPGLLMALHTWGRNLSFHPHVHCLLSAGGVTPDGAWQHTRAGFLLPLRLLQHLLRGKLLGRLKALLQQQRLVLPPEQPLAHWLACLRTLYRAHWNIEVQAPYGHARGVAVYLARYVKGGPLPADRPLSIDSHHLVRVPYFDHRDHQPKTLCLRVHEFIARLLWHAPPARQHTVRYAGLYASAHREQHLLARTALGATAAATAQHEASTSALAVPSCPRCGSPLSRRFSARPPHFSGAFTLPPSPTHATTEHLGPTGRSNGQPTAKAPRPQPPPYHLAAAGGGL
ncbi:MAG TPA: transposase [Burkholderiaceae bacterium]|nr:transposase [Burkholderiaceae bacterium]